MNRINQFVSKLSTYKGSGTVFNPYEDPKVANNLKAYLSYMLTNDGKDILLVGEAPGHRGCRITGIPFTSGTVINSKKHNIFKEIGKGIHLSKVESENTAKIVWEYLEGKDQFPLFWNSFPFHPHPENLADKNRKPTHDEIQEGIEYLVELKSVFPPKIIGGIGHLGVSCAKQVFPKKEVIYIRHPSYGGEKYFIEGMNKIISSLQ